MAIHFWNLSEKGQSQNLYTANTGLSTMIQCCEEKLNQTFLAYTPEHERLDSYNEKMDGCLEVRQLYEPYQSQHISW